MTSTTPPPSAASKTQALVDSISRDLRPYLCIPSTFQQNHIQQLASAIARQSNNDAVIVSHVEIKPHVTCALTVLLQSVTSSLTQLTVKGPTVETMKAVIQLIQETTSLKTLTLEGIPASMIPDLFQALLSNTSIRVLDLGNNDLNDIVVLEGLSTLLLQQQDNNISCLMLNKTHLTSLTWLERALEHNTTLRVLSLADNDIADLQPLVQVMKTNVTLQRIYLYGNKYSSSEQQQHYKTCIGQFLRLNVVGRQLLLQQQEQVHVGLYAYILGRVSNEPALIYGLLREVPQLWTRTQDG